MDVCRRLLVRFPVWSSPLAARKSCLDTLVRLYASVRSMEQSNGDESGKQKISFHDFCRLSCFLFTSFLGADLKHTWS